MGAAQRSDDAARNLYWNLGANLQANLGANLGALGHDMGRSSRSAFSGFDVPATGQGRGSFHRYIPICRPFCGIWPGIRALLEALAAAKYRSPSVAGSFLNGRMPHGCAAPRRRERGAGLADFLTPRQALMRPRPGLTQSFKRQPFQALSLRSVLAGRTPPPI